MPSSVHHLCERFGADSQRLNSLIGCFADDTRLIKAIRGESIEADMFLLEVDLHRVIRWALENNIELNESKFDYSLDQLLHFLDPFRLLRVYLSMRLLAEPGSRVQTQ